MAVVGVGRSWDTLSAPCYRADWLCPVRVLCRYSHSCCESASECRRPVMARDTISLQSSLTSGSYDLPVPSLQIVPSLGMGKGDSDVTLVA